MLQKDELALVLPTVLVLFTGCKRLKIWLREKEKYCVDQTQNVGALDSVLQVQYQC
jgi:hypothetical protein